MSKYTTQVRFICESLAGREESGGFDDIDNVIEASREAIFGNSYTLFDENYRATLETKILKHYYTREIGLESFALWKHFLRTRMNEIMPYYNQLYKSETLEFNPLYDFTYTRDFHREDEEEKQAQKIDKSTRTDNTNSSTNTSSNNTRTDNTNSETNTTSNNTRTDNTNSATTGTVSDQGWDTVIGKTIDRYSDTPQGGIDGIEPIDRENRYLTNVNIESIDNNNTTNNTRTYNTNYANTGTVGNAGTGKTTTANTGTVGNAGTGKSTTVNTGTVGNAGTGTSTTVNTGTIKFDTDTEDAHTINNLSDYIEHVTGKRGGESYAKMLMDYRKSMLNIDMMIIRELGDLFMCIY